MRKLLLILGLFVATQAAAQNQYYVAATGGNNSNSGTSVGSPWATCNFAVANAALNSVGAVINFIASSSTHAACSTINRNVTAPARLVLKCTQPWTTDGHTPTATHCKMAGAFLITGSGNNIDIGAIPYFGFEYTNTADNTGIDGVTPCATDSGACAFGNGIHVLGNYLHDIATGCPSSGAIIMPNQHGVTVTDIQVIGNVIDHFGTYPQSGCNVAQGIYIASGNGQIYNNVVTRSAYAGLQYYDQACNARISNNVFANNNEGMVLYGGRGCNAGLNTVDNNIIVNNVNQAINNSFSGDQGCTTGRQTLYSNNIISGNGTNGPTSTFASCTSSQNQKSEAPTTTFVNYTGTAAGDYHIKAGSIAIAGGTSNCATGAATPCVPSADQNGGVRPSGGAQDIGVFVFSSGAVPQVSLTPSPLAFGSVPVATSSTQTATLGNPGSANLTFSAATIAGTNASDFSILSTTCASPLAAGNTCTYSIRFTPQATGARAANLTLNDNAAGSPHQLPLTGTGGAAALTLNPTSLSFGAIAPATCSPVQTSTATSTGTAAITLGAETITGTNPGDFAFGGIGTCSGGQILNPGQSCTISAKFCPTSVGAKSANIATPSNDPTSPDLLGLTGTGGAPAVGIAPTSANCGSVQIGNSVTCQAFTLTNTGNIDLTSIVVTIQ